MGFFAWLGVGSAILAILSYLLLTVGYIRAQRGFAVLTLICSAFTLISMQEQFHAGTVLINVFFAGISLWGLMNPLPNNEKEIN